MKKLYHICQKYKKQRESNLKPIGIRFEVRGKRTKAGRKKNQSVWEMKGIQGEIIPKNKNFIAKEHFFGE